MIQVSALHKHYGAVRALDGLDLSVAGGAVFGFLGPNGAGKTTTLRILVGLAKATSGAAKVAGVDLGAGGRELSGRIGYLPEEPAFYPWMTPVEFLDYLGRLHGLPVADRSARVRQLLDLVHLSDVSKRRIGGFSRGMRQRLGLASALIHDPQVLFFDEPVSALDPLGRKEILALIESLRDRHTVLMSSHILADVERVCTHVGIIAGGRMLVQAPREELMARYAQPIFSIEVEGQAAAEAWAQELRARPWISAVQVDGVALRITVSDVSMARRELIPAAVSHQVVVRRYDENRPSLEDVFMQLVEVAK